MRAVLCLLYVATSHGQGPCGDKRLSGLEDLDGVTGAAPAFMVAPMEAICKEAALAAVANLKADCADLRSLLAREEYQTCEKLGAVLLSAASTKGCHCQAAEIIADADASIAKQVLAMGPPIVRKTHALKAGWSASRGPTLGVAFGSLIVVGAAVANYVRVLQRRAGAAAAAPPLDIL